MFMAGLGFGGANPSSSAAAFARVPGKGVEAMDENDGNLRSGSPAERNPALAETARATPAQLRYLRLGMRQPGGKLPLFDPQGQEIDSRTIRSCIDHGWAKPWFDNPVHPNWLVCRLTDSGRRVASS